jgi:hypothetical protein
VRWYLRYALSYRDLEEMMEERGLAIDHTTIYRWVQRYAPELEKRCRPHLCSTNDSYRVTLYGANAEYEFKAGEVIWIGGSAHCTENIGAGETRLR